MIPGDGKRLEVAHSGAASNTQVEQTGKFRPAPVVCDSSVWWWASRLGGLKGELPHLETPWGSLLPGGLQHLGEELLGPFVLWVGNQLARISLFNHDAAIDERQRIGDLAGETDLVGYQHHGHAAHGQ